MWFRHSSQMIKNKTLTLPNAYHPPSRNYSWEGDVLKQRPRPAGTKTNSAAKSTKRDYRGGGGFSLSLFSVVINFHSERQVARFATGINGVSAALIVFTALLPRWKASSSSSRRRRRRVKVSMAHHRRPSIVPRAVKREPPIRSFFPLLPLLDNGITGKKGSSYPFSSP